MNHMIHIAAATQIRLDTDGRAYYRRKIAAGKTRRGAMRCLKRRISDALYRQLRADAKTASVQGVDAGPGGHRGASHQSSAAGSPRTPALRISHFPDPHPRRYPRPPLRGRPRRRDSSNQPLDVRGVPEGRNWLTALVPTPGRERGGRRPGGLGPRWRTGRHPLRF